MGSLGGKAKQVSADYKGGMSMGKMAGKYLKPLVVGNGIKLAKRPD